MYKQKVKSAIMKALTDGHQLDDSVDILINEITASEYKQVMEMPITEFFSLFTVSDLIILSRKAK